MYLRHSPILIEKLCLELSINIQHSYIGFILAFASSIHNKLVANLQCTSGLCLFSADHPMTVYWVRLSTLTVVSSTSAAPRSHSRTKNKVGPDLPTVTDLHTNLNLDGEPIVSKSHTHPSHSETSRLLTSSLSLGVPVPRPTQCV
jgi:hypothetical protein